MVMSSGSVKDEPSDSNSSNADPKIPPGCCQHLVSFLSQSGAESYGVLVEHFVACVSEHDRKRKASSCICFKCRARERLHSCLHCVYFGCYTSRHIHAHYESCKDHFLAVDLSHGQVYCFLCKDYRYHDILDGVLTKFVNKSRKNMKLPLLYKTWEPPSDEVLILFRHSKRRKLEVNSTIGLRGLINLGNTCFMSVIMQVFIHTPVLRDFFLSDKHTCNQENCLVCEISRLFQEFHCGIRTPHIPYKLLHLIWTHAKHLAGYEQQDAHEFFISTLDMLHKRCVDYSKEHGINEYSSNTTNGSSHQTCNCVIDQIFTGFLRSDVICTNCQNVSTTFDPFWDISLDVLSSDPLSPTRPVFPAENEANSNEKSLIGCLKRFTRKEYLGSGARIHCDNCKEHQESTKQLTLNRLPTILCFHFKRFQQSTGLHKKISDFVSFPFDIDLARFTSAGAQLLTEAADKNMSPPNLASVGDCRYSLFAVVNHTGQIDNGHYTCFVKHREDQWFACDDHLITRANTPETVAKSQAYLLFYCKQFLHYSPPPSSSSLSSNASAT